MYNAVVWACSASESVEACHCLLGFRAVGACPVTAVTAYFNCCHFIVWWFEPLCLFHNPGKVEEYGCSSRDTCQPRPAFAVGITGPYGNYIFRGCSYCPCIPETEAGSRFPCQFRGGGKILPAGFSFGAVYFPQGFVGEPDRCSRKGRAAFFGTVLFR